jgi:exosome complex component RRP41
MSKAGAPEKLIIDGKRLDGRELDEFRKMDADVHVLKHAQGSGMFSFGDTKSIVGVFGPRTFHPRRLQKPKEATLRCKYFMAPFSTEDRIRPGHSRRGTEISKVITEAFSSVVSVEGFPKSGIDVFIDIVQASASTRCAGINAAAIALADAGVEMTDLISSVAVGKVDDTIVLDVGKAEDNYGQVDFAVSTIGGSDKFVHMQMDGVVSREEFSKMLTLAVKGCKEVYEKQKEVLRKKYGGESNDQ